MRRSTTMQSKRTTGLWPLILMLAMHPLAASEPEQSPVVVNGQAMTAEQQAVFTATYGSPPIPGKYWYDARSGLYGYVGAGPMGSMQPGHDYGALAADASGGATGVFINGRELPLMEVQLYAQLLGPVLPGRYWLDATGNVGREGEPQALANLFGAAAQAGGAPGASSDSAAGSAGEGAMTYTDQEGYVWRRHLFDCQLQEGPGTLVLDVSTIQDTGLTWDQTKRPRPEISGVIGLDQQIRYMQGEFHVNGQAHRFTGRGAHFSFGETLDNSLTGRFELRGSTLAVYYPFDNPTPGLCTPSANQ